MKIGLDTSVVIRLLVGVPAPQAQAAAVRLQRHHDNGDPVIVTDLVIAESYYALHHHYDVPKAEARKLLRRFIESGVVTPDPEASTTVLTQTGGAGLVDRLIHARHVRLGARTLTFERRQGQLDDAERLKD